MSKKGERFPESLRKRQQVLEAIRNYIAQHGYSPSTRELSALVGIGSTQTMHKYLHHLRAEGRITFHPYRNRTIRLSD